MGATETDMGRDRDSNVLAGNCSTSLTRRGLFELAGLATAAAVLPARAGLGARPASPAIAAGQPVSPVMEKLSTYMSEARSRALPDEGVEKTKQHILDTLAAMVSGCNLAPGRDAIRFVTAYGGKEVATVIGSSVVCGPIEAALTNAMLSLRRTRIPAVQLYRLHWRQESSSASTGCTF